MKNHLLRERVVRFWNGDKFTFEKVDTDKWICIYKDSEIIPHSIIEELERGFR